LRDATALAAAITAASRDQLGGRAMLDAYRDSRLRDATRGVAFTDLLVSTFADGRRLPTWGRGLALSALDLVPAARRMLAERMIHGAPT
jgi:2-octaprenyl-6-methoxyphenol hydroxylase